MNGLELITPTSVDGTGVSLSGAKVIFTDERTISVNGVFDSTYDNYLVVIRLRTTSASVMNARLRANGSDASGSDYTVQELRAGGSVSTQRFLANYFRVGGAHSDVAQNGSHAYFYGPALAQPTAVRSLCIRSDSGARIIDNANTHSLSTSYDGFTIVENGSGMLTGALTIYGLTK